MKRSPALLRAVQGVLALLLICVGVGFIYWPAGLIVAGVLLVIDRQT